MDVSKWTGVPVAALAVLAGCAPQGAPIQPQPLSPAAVIDSVISTPPLHRTHWGIQVVEARSARTLHRVNAEKHFRPASNMKLVVTAVALAELGPDYRYRTDIHALGFEPADDSVADALLVEGRGDPTLSERFHPTDYAVLDSLADSLAHAGVRRVAGDLVIDASYFDSTRVHPTWEIGDLPWYYAAPVAAFGIAEGAFPVRIGPGPAPGEPARFEVLAPRRLIGVAGRVVTDTAGADYDLDVTRLEESDSIVVSGRVPLLEEPDTSWLAVLDPAEYAGRALALALEDRGIAVEGDVRVVFDSADAAAVRERTAGRARAPIATWTSPPLGEIVAGILEPSQNWIAEHLLKTLGAELEGEGSWSAGLEVEERYLFEVVGIDSAAVYLRDASGLSAQNLLAPEAVVQLLSHARGAAWGDVYRAALAEPGEEGTLESRLLELRGRLAAKTGTITHVNALSGYLVGGDGDRELIFSILTDGSGQPSSDVRAAIDRIIHAIAR